MSCNASVLHVALEEEDSEVVMAVLGGRFGDFPTCEEVGGWESHRFDSQKDPLQRCLFLRYGDRI